MPGPVVAHRNRDRSVGCRRLDRHLALVGELDGVAHEVEQHLGELALVAVTARQIGSKLDLERDVLLLSAAIRPRCARLQPRPASNSRRVRG